MVEKQRATAVTEYEISVVAATYNRGSSFRILLDQLCDQTVRADSFEVIVVDDGSKTPASEALEDFSPTYEFTLIRQKNMGAAVARHNGIEKSRGKIVVVVDDDMQLKPDFLEQHKQVHDHGAEVALGRMIEPAEFDNMPLFSKFHQHQLDLYARRMTSGVEVRGTFLCTGNVSFRRDLYFQVGGFDPSLKQAEDRELGMRFEKAGANMAFAPKAVTINRSDHTSLDAWLESSFNYGIWDRRIAYKHQDLLNADPWRFISLVNPISRPVLLAVAAVPAMAPRLSRTVMAVSGLLDQMHVERLALAGATLAYGIQYFAGVRRESGSLSAAFGGLAKYMGRSFKK